MTTTCAKSNVSNAKSIRTFEPLAVLAARAACALQKSIEGLVLASDQNLGHLEVQAVRGVEELLRQAVERGAQAKADASGTRNFIPALAVPSTISPAKTNISGSTAKESSILKRFIATAPNDDAQRCAAENSRFQSRRDRRIRCSKS